MKGGIYSYIFAFSKREQLILLAFTAVALPFFYISLEIPKTIINEAIGGTDFPHNVLGAEFGQIPYLFVLCSVFLILVIVNGAFKFKINVYKGVLAERMLRRMRYQLIERLLRFPLAHFRKTSHGELVSMISAETEVLGTFIGDAVALPAFQGGTLATILVFVFMQDWRMGLAAIALYPLQAYFIPKVQKRLNMLVKERVREVRKFSERIAEVVSGAHDVRAHDTYRYELADFSHRLGRIFHIRHDIYRRKFLIKSINNFIGSLTPLFIFALGGYLVIAGDLTFGAMVAILAACKDLSAPWKELLTYYQRKEDARVRYDQLIEQFHPADMLDEALATTDVENPPPLGDRLLAANLHKEEDGSVLIDGATLDLDLPGHAAIVGHGGAKSELARLLARLSSPTSGSITINERDLAEMPVAVTGRQISYVGQETYIRSGSVRDNLVYGLKHRPGGDGTAAPADEAKEAGEAIRAGNSAEDIFADWIDYQTAGATGEADLTARMIHVLDVVELEEDTYLAGLKRTIDPAEKPHIAEAAVAARAKLRKLLAAPEIAELVEMFDPDKFNASATVGENIFFGTPVGPAFEVERLGDNPHVLTVLEQVGLADEFVNSGYRLAKVMTEIFRDLPPGHEFFERFSFIGSDDLSVFEDILRQVENNGMAALGDAERARLRALPFQIIPGRHRLGLIDNDMCERILEARRVFADTLPPHLVDSVEFFGADKYNAASTVQDNILFGKLVSGKPESAKRVGALISQVVDELGLRDGIVELGLDFEVGTGGSRLQLVQRQKLAVARCLLKQPEVLVVNEGLSALGQEIRPRIIERIKTELAGRTLIWVDAEPELSQIFGRVFEMDSGKISRTKDARAEGETMEPRERPRTAPPAADKAANGGAEDDMSLNAAADMLREVPMFSDLDRSKLKLLAFTAEWIDYEANQILYHQGDKADRAYVLLEGEVDVIIDTCDGPRTVTVLDRRNMVGEPALLADRPRWTTVRARTPLKVLAISRNIFRKMIHEDAEIGLSVSRTIASRLADTRQNQAGSETPRHVVTGLPNYLEFAEHFRQTAALAERHGRLSVLMTLNLEQLHQLESGITKAEADDLLRQVAERIKICMRETDTLAHLRRTEFAITMEEISRLDDTQLVAQRVADELGYPIRVGEREFRLGPVFKFSILLIEGKDVADSLETCRSGKAAPLAVSA